jgi:hypothetical protein
VKQFSLASSIAVLILAWPRPSFADQQFEVLVQSAILIQTPPVPAYRLRQQVTELAKDGDRLDAVGMAAQSAQSPLLLALERRADGLVKSQIQLLPHSRIRITAIAPLANGQTRMQLAIEQGQMQFQINPSGWPIQRCHIRQWPAAAKSIQPCSVPPTITPWHLNGLRAMGLRQMGQVVLEQLG